MRDSCLISRDIWWKCGTVPLNAGRLTPLDASWPCRPVTDLLISFYSLCYGSVHPIWVILHQLDGAHLLGDKWVQISFPSGVWHWAAEVELTQMILQSGWCLQHYYQLSNWEKLILFYYRCLGLVLPGIGQTLICILILSLSKLFHCCIHEQFSKGCHYYRGVWKKKGTINAVNGQ